MFNTQNPALLIVDVQTAIDEYVAKSDRNNLDAEKKIQHLLSVWRDMSLPIIHIRHASKNHQSPYHANSITYSFKPEVEPLECEEIITKSENSAFIHTKLDALLQSMSVKELVICGVLTNNSVDATVRVASGLGYRVFLPNDGTAAAKIHLIDGGEVEAEIVHAIFLSNLHDEYCQVTTSSDVCDGLRS